MGKDFWSYLKQFAKDKIDYQDLTNSISKYQPTQQDFQNVYYGDVLKKIFGKDWKQVDCHQEEQDQPKVHTATQFYQDWETGEKFIIQYQVQYFQHEKHSNKIASVISKAFLQFNYKHKFFEVKDQVLLDVYDQFWLD